MLRGIDVSSVQSISNWKAVKDSGIDFVYVQVGFGNNGSNPGFRAKLLGAKSAGLLVGAYHFLFPLPDRYSGDSRNPVAQARAHFALCGKLDLKPMVDLEWPVIANWIKWGADPAHPLTKEFIIEFTLEYLQELGCLSGNAPLLYTYRDYWNNQLHANLDARFAPYPLAIADYDHYQGAVPPDGSSPSPVKPWAGWALWQYSGSPDAHGRCMRLPDGQPVDSDVCADISLITQV